ncbi:hypothetical protein ABZ281_27125 [Streptomyces sp. NPDC006265]|uniref:hypothetical protein n=1 Tax=Streptomyces sp. NPDC006265 TaxID=3156740 RepID=UPI0033A9ACBC
MPTRTDTIDDLFTGLRVDKFSGTIDRDDAYTVVLSLLDNARSVQDRTTLTELWTVLQTIPGAEPFGGRARLHQLLHTAERDGEIRRTASGHILLRLDAPSSGGPEHVWVRLDGRGASGAEVEITGADPWPDHQLHAPGPAWWRCTGCRDHSGTIAQDFLRIRDDATEHASTCRALPAPPAVA